MRNLLKQRLSRAFIFLFFLSSCSRITQQKPFSGEQISIMEIRNRVQQNSWKLSSMKGQAHVTIETPQMGFTAVSDIILKQPDSLLVHVKAGFGMGVGTIFFHKNQFIVYSSMENRAYLGDINAFRLRQFFPIHFHVSDIIEVVTGIPVLKTSDSCSLVIDNGKYLVTTENESYKKECWIDPKKYVITDLRLYDTQTELIITQEFRQFQKEKGVYLPKLIRIRNEKVNSRFTLFYTDRKTNSKINTKDFILNIPEKTKRINLSSK